MLREANEVIGARQYYRYGEALRSDEFSKQFANRPCDLTRLFSMLREANEVIGARQYYRYGERRLSEV